CSIASSAITCSFGPLRPGGVATVTVSGVTDGSFTGPLTNAATAASPTADPVPANNTGTGSVQVNASADVAIPQTPTPPTPDPGPGPHPRPPHDQQRPLNRPGGPGQRSPARRVHLRVRLGGHRLHASGGRGRRHHHLSPGRHPE